MEVFYHGWGIVQLFVQADAKLPKEVNLMNRHEAWKLLRGPEGVAEWNRRRSLGEEIPDLSSLNLHGASLRGVNLRGVKMANTPLGSSQLGGADLSNADLGQTDFKKANLTSTKLQGSNLTSTNLEKANLEGANFEGANLTSANLASTNFTSGILRKANLTNTNLQHALLFGVSLEESHCQGTDFRRCSMIEANCRGAYFNECKIYGISTWDVKLAEAVQKNLVISEKPYITVDNLKVAQFVHTLLTNEEVREVVNTLTTKTVLILGRFTEERKVVLDAIRNELRNQNYVPILFDFEGPSNRSVDETIGLLARWARFIIADITDAKSVPQELRGIVPDLPHVPVAPLLASGHSEYGMFEHFKNYPWVLPIHCYKDPAELLRDLSVYVIAPAEMKAEEVN